MALTLLIFPAVGMLPPHEFREHIVGALHWIQPAAILVAGTALNAQPTGMMPLKPRPGWWVRCRGVRGMASPDVAVIGELTPMTGTAVVCPHR